MDTQSLGADDTVIENGNSGSAGLPRFIAGATRASARARAACQLCRWKKVRCDARDGKRCSNCVFDEVECIVPPKRPRKYIMSAVNAVMNLVSTDCGKEIGGSKS